MRESIPPDITALLDEIAGGDDAAWEDLLPQVYDLLRRVAGRHFAQEGPELTLQPTALVNEACARLMQQESAGFENRSHFLAIASLVMRRILVDHAHQRNAQKRGGGWSRTTLHGLAGRNEDSQIDLIDLDDALQELEAANERQARIVALRFFGGLQMSEIAEALTLSVATVERDWRVARAWLSLRLRS